MRKIAFGYSTRCNIKCSHCVAADDSQQTPPVKMDLERAKEIIREMAEAGVTGISFTAGEPFIYFDDLLQLIALCHNLQIYSRVVTNSYWASSPEKAEERLAKLKDRGLCQLRMSFSRWHQQHVPQHNIVNAANGCIKNNVTIQVIFLKTNFCRD